MEHQKWAWQTSGLALAAWVLGRSASQDEFELAERAKTPTKRAMHMDRAMTLGLASNIGAGYAFYNSLKTHPRLTAAAFIAYFGFAAFASASSLPPGQSPFVDRLIGRSKRMAPLPAYDEATETAGWGWGY
jgi:hypothetical protein